MPGFRLFALRAFVLGTAAFAALSVFAQEPKQEATEELEKKLANPVSDVTALPLQFNFNFDSTKDNLSQSVFNIQPVISGPISHGSLIHRFILPVVDQPSDTGTSSVSGFGDLTYEGLFAPKANGKITWALGALLQAPTGGPLLGSRKWAAGPAALVLTESERLTLGALLTQAWSFAGSSQTRDVNLFTIQPIASYRIGSGWSFTPFNNITYNGSLDGEKWTVPLGVSLIKLLPRRSVPVNLTFGVFGNVVHPKNAADWSMKFQMNFVL